MLNLYVIADTLIVLPLLVLSVMVLLHGGYKLRRNVSLTLFSILVAIWIVANHLGNDLATPSEIAVVANYFVFSCSFAAMVLVMLFAVQLGANKRLISLAKVSLPVLGVITVLAATPLVGAGVERQENIYGVIFGPLVIPYGVALIYMITVTLIAIELGLRHNRGIRHNQLQVVGASLLFALPLVLSVSFILPSLTGLFWLTEFGVMPLAVLVAALYYSVIRHQLFDVRFVVVRGVAYACVLASLSIVYYLLAYVVSVVILGGQTTDTVSVSPINIMLALFLTLIFQPIKLFFDRATNKYFYKENYSSVGFFAQLSHILTSTTDLRGMLERVSTEMATTLKSEQVFFFLYYTNAIDHHMSAGTHSHARLPLHDARLLDDYAESTEDPVFLTEFLSENITVQRMLRSHKIALVMPLRQGETIAGYVMLGEHRSGTYTKRDLKILLAISNELVIAIQNALSLHEIKELNATLQQKIDVATKELRYSNAQLRHLDEVKDEFMSMASHQLRTPLTSIKGYMSMVLEGDLGEISPQQRKVLGEAFNSSERMVRLIADFLNVSRLQTGKFLIEKTPFDLGLAVKQEVDALHLMMVTHDLNLKLHLPKSPVPVVADEAKLRQVIMNFIDNAVYYSPPGSDIAIDLISTTDGIDFTVTDSGIGVPKAEQVRLFDKFFRATNARRQRPDGTGVGLYLAKKVMTAHDGSMIFRSVEGKGSTFGFHLPPTK